MGVGDGLAGRLVKASYKLVGRDDGTGHGGSVLDLGDLSKHGVIEHDASLTRGDCGVGECVEVDLGLVVSIFFFFFLCVGFSFIRTQAQLTHYSPFFSSPFFYDKQNQLLTYTQDNTTQGTFNTNHARHPSSVPSNPAAAI